MAEQNVVGGAEAGVAEWAQPYVNQLLVNTSSYANSPSPQYNAPLTAGSSQLQQQGFQGLAGLTMPNSIGTAQNYLQGFASQGVPNYTSGMFSPGTATASTFGNAQAQQYMSPYMQNVVDIQKREAARQADQQRMKDAARLVGSGAFGGSRQALMEAEGNRNLGTLMNDIQGKGLQSAYENAQQMFERDQNRGMQAQAQNMQYGMDAQKLGEQSRQFGANLGLQGLGQQTSAAAQLGNLGLSGGRLGLDQIAAQLAGGATQQQTEQTGLTADYQEWLRLLNDPAKKLQLQQSMLQGMPISASTLYAPEADPLSSFLSGAGGILPLLNAFMGSGTK